MWWSNNFSNLPQSKKWAFPSKGGKEKKNKKHYRVHCLTCERNYFCVRGPLAHLKRVHLDLKYHMCHKCSYKFLTEKIAIYMSPYAATKILDFDIINMKFLWILPEIPTTPWYPKSIHGNTKSSSHWSKPYLLPYGNATSSSDSSKPYIQPYGNSKLSSNWSKPYV